MQIIFIIFHLHFKKSNNLNLYYKDSIKSLYAKFNVKLYIGDAIYLTKWLLYIFL